MRKEDLKDWTRDMLKTEIIRLTEENFHLMFRDKQHEDSERRLETMIESEKMEIDKMKGELRRLREKCGEVPARTEKDGPKRKFDIGDVVLCHKFGIENKFVLFNASISVQPYLDTMWFNRKAYISNTYKRCMEQHGTEHPEDKDEYEITFLDDGHTLAWVSGKELTLILKN